MKQLKWTEECSTCVAYSLDDCPQDKIVETTIKNRREVLYAHYEYCVSGWERTSIDTLSINDSLCSYKPRIVLDHSVPQNVHERADRIRHGTSEATPGGTLQGIGGQAHPSDERTLSNGRDESSGSRRLGQGALGRPRPRADGPEADAAGIKRR